MNRIIRDFMQRGVVTCRVGATAAIFTSDAAVLACASLYPLVRIKELPAEKKSLDRGGLL